MAGSVCITSSTRLHEEEGMGQCDALEEVLLRNFSPDCYYDKHWLTFNTPVWKRVSSDSRIIHPVTLQKMFKIDLRKRR